MEEKERDTRYNDRQTQCTHHNYDVSLLRSISAPRLNQSLEPSPDSPSSIPSVTNTNTNTLAPFLNSSVWSYSSQSLSSHHMSWDTLPVQISNSANIPPTTPISPRTTEDIHTTSLTKTKIKTKTKTKPTSTSQPTSWAQAKPFLPTSFSSGSFPQSDSSPNRIPRDIETQTQTKVSDITFTDQLEMFLCHPYISQHITSLILQLQPSIYSEVERSTALEYISSLLSSSPLSPKVIATGSFALKTYLRPSPATIDLVLFFTHNHLRSWTQRTLRTLCSSSELSSSCLTQTESLSTTFRESVTVKLTANDSSRIGLTVLFEQFDVEIGRDHLYKRTALLTKAWTRHEAGIPQQQLSDEALCTLVMFLFVSLETEMAVEVETPLQGLWRLLEYLSEFSWESHVFSVNGPIPIHKCSNSFDRAFLNILSPYNAKHKPNNLGGSIDKTQAKAIRQLFASCTCEFRNTVTEWGVCRGMHSQAVGRLFAHTFELLSSSVSDDCYQEGKEQIGTDILDGQLQSMKAQCRLAEEFDVPDLSEDELVELVKRVLANHEGAVTVGKMGSLLHSATNNHSLPAMLKAKYGGLKKLLRRHESVFYIADDHPHNPRVYLRDASPALFPSTQLEQVQPQKEDTAIVNVEDIPFPFLCPICRIIMSDPVVTSEGISYERKALEAFREQSGMVSPLTGLPVETTVFPNVNLRHMIEAFLRLQTLPRSS